MIRRVKTLTVVALLSLCPWRAMAQEATEGTLKGAFIFNIAMFTVWPEDVLPSGAPLTACVVGDDAVASALTRHARNRLMAGHPLIVATRSVNAIQGCHVLYLSSASAEAVSQAMVSTAGTPVLTIGELDEFARHGGGIAQLFVEGGKMRFRVNLGSVKRARLQLSSRLLSLAVVVNE